MPPRATRPQGDIRKGFVYKRVPHVTLKSIANNPDIKEGMTREQIDAAIARHADTETLYDQPYEDKKRVRVTRAVHGREPVAASRRSPTDRRATGRPSGSRQPTPSRGDFATMILDNLRKAGVQNTVKGERLELRPARALRRRRGSTPTGEYTDADGTTRRVAVSHRPRARHGRPAAGQGSRQGGGARASASTC